MTNKKKYKKCLTNYLEGGSIDNVERQKHNQLVSFFRKEGICVMIINLEDVKERLKKLYNEINLPNDVYLKKKNKECEEFNLKLEPNHIDAIKVGETKGTIEALLYLLEN